MTIKQAKIIIPPPPCFTLDTAQTLSKDDGFPTEPLQDLNRMSSMKLCIIQKIFFDMFSRLRKNFKFHETIIFGEDLNNFFKIGKRRHLCFGALQGAEYKF